MELVQKRELVVPQEESVAEPRREHVVVFALDRVLGRVQDVLDEEKFVRNENFKRKNMTMWESERLTNLERGPVERNQHEVAHHPQLHHLPALQTLFSSHRGQRAKNN